MYDREQRTGSCNTYDRSSSGYKRLHHEEDLRSRIPRDRPYPRTDRFSEGSDRKRRHLEPIKPVNAKDRPPDLRVDKTPKLVDSADEVSEEVVRKTTAIISRLIKDHYVENEPLSHSVVVDAVVEAVVNEPAAASCSEHPARRPLLVSKSAVSSRVPSLSSVGKESIQVKTVDVAVPVNLSLIDPRPASAASTVFPPASSSSVASLISFTCRQVDSADAESGVVTSTDSLPQDVYSSTHKNEDHGCEVSSSSDKPLVKNPRSKARERVVHEFAAAGVRGPETSVCRTVRDSGQKSSAARLTIHQHLTPGSHALTQKQLHHQPH